MARARKTAEAPESVEQEESAPKPRTPRKRAAKKPSEPAEKKVAPKREGDTLVIETKQVPVGELKPYYKNPRIGNVNEIAKSLHVNGQYRGIVVNVGTYTGRKNEILAGNHTFYGAKKKITWTQDGKQFVKEPWGTILVSFVDVDEEGAAKIVLADNRTAELGTMDDKQLALIFKELEDASGTGYDADEMQELLESIPTEYDLTYEDTSLEEMLEAPADERTDATKKKTKREEIMERRRQEALEQAEEAKRTGERPEADTTSRRGVIIDDPTAPDDLDDVVDKRAELQVMLEVKEGERYPFENYMGIPVLLKDKLVPVIKGRINTWAGPKLTPDDGTSHYIWNTGLVSMTGLPDDGRTILSFFTHETKYEGWWNTPSYYVAKAINYGIKYAISPDFSLWIDDPRALQVYNTYRNFWLGRYMQECGLEIIPRFSSADPESTKFTLAGIPEGTPMVAINLQAANPDEIRKARFDKSVTSMIEQKQPQTLIVYAGPPGRRFIEGLNLEDQFGIEVKHVLNYSGIRNLDLVERQKGNKKLTAAEKKKIRERAERRVMNRLDLEDADAIQEDDFDPEDFDETSEYDDDYDDSEDDTSAQ